MKVAERVRKYEEMYANAGFEECMSRLQAISSGIDTASGVEDALEMYAESVVLIRKCRKMIEDTQLEIKLLREYADGSIDLENLKNPDA